MQRKLGLALAAGAAVSLFAGAASAQVAWRSGQEDERVVLDAATNAQALVQFSQKGERFVIGFSRPITQVERASLLSKGVRLLAPLGGDSYFGIVSGNLDAAGALAAAPVVSVRSIRLEWKMDDFIRQGRIMPWTVVREGGMEGISRKNPIVGTLVLLHPDVAQDARTIEMVEALGGEVRDMLDSVNIIVVEMPYANLARLAADNRVQWIETPRPIMSPVNNSNRALVGADIVHAAPYGLSGLGVSAFVYDAGTSSLTHPDLAGRVTKVDTASVGEHATHVTGTVGGNGTNNPNYKGMAPKATLLTASFEWTGGGVFLYENPGDVDADYGKAIQQHNADVANNSIGSNTESNGFPCEIQGNYGLTDTVIDAIVRGSKGRPFRVVWANGNERQGSRCDVEGYGDYYSIAPPATAKNHMTVGALNSNDDSMTWFSSWGPTDDGRMKPDISAPGCQSDGDNGVTSTSSGGGYSTMCGTSMASPTVCGLSALLLEDYRNQFPGLDDPRNSLLRIFFGPICPSLQLGNHVNAKFRDGDEQPIKDRFKRRHVRVGYLEEVTPELIEKFISTRIRQDHISPKTANRQREILHRMFQYAIKNWRFTSTDRRFPNPAAAVERRREPAPEIRYLNDEQIAQQLDILKDHPMLHAMVAAYIYAGVRREELLWLTLEDVDLDRRLMFVRAKTIDGQFWQPKTRRNRVVPIGLTLRDILAAYRPTRTGPWFFPSTTGRKWDPDNFSQELREINGEHGLSWSCLDFRHTFGSHLAQNGTSLFKIAELMGNSPDICRRHYAALCPEKMHDVVEFNRPGDGQSDLAATQALLEKLIDRIGRAKAEPEPLPRLRLVQ